MIMTVTQCKLSHLLLWAFTEGFFFSFCLGSSPQLADWSGPFCWLVSLRTGLFLQPKTEHVSSEGLMVPPPERHGATFSGQKVAPASHQPEETASFLRFRAELVWDRSTNRLTTAWWTTAPPAGHHKAKVMTQGPKHAVLEAMARNLSDLNPRLVVNL